MKKIGIFIIFLVLLPEFCPAGVRVIGSLTREKTAGPGETYEEAILLMNSEETPCEVKVYQTDYTFFCDGRNMYGEPGHEARSNAGWLMLNPNRLIIPPHEKASVYYRLEVPEDAHLTGTYWSMVMVEQIPATSPESIVCRENDKITMSLQTVIRYGIQIITNIGDTGIRKIRFLDKKLISLDGKKIFRIDIENIGDRSLSPSLWAELYNREGRSIGRFDGRKARIYPGCSIRNDLELAGVKPGTYKTLVVVDNGDDHIFGAQYDLEIGE
ncbi:MAG: hypothetical protein ACMUIA_10120 [bacterium]